MSRAARTPGPGSGKWNITPSPSHLMGLPPCSTEFRRTSRATVAASSAAASSPRSCVSRVYPLMSRKQIAGSRSRRLWIPARSIISSNASTMLPVQPRAWCAWYMARTAWSTSGVIRLDRSALPICSTPLPAAMAGSITSVYHHAASCSVIRRVLSPWTRSSRSMAAGRNPSASCSSRNGRICSSSSRSRSSGEGGAIPIASRTTISSSSGIPVRSLTCRNVSSASAANRS